MWSTTKLAGLLTICLCIGGVTGQQTDDLEDTTRDPLRWKTSGDDVVLLIRKADEEHPYFKSMMFRKSANKSDILPKLTQMISHHCNVANISKLVKNDLLVLRTPLDGSELTSGDRIEVWTVKSGLATRSKTFMAFSKYGRKDSQPKPVGPPMMGSSGGGSGPHHGGGGGGGRKDRKERKDRRAAIPSRDASTDNIFDSIDAEGL